MKNLLYQAIIFSLVCSIVACSPSAEDTQSTNTSEPQPTKSRAYQVTVKDTISLSTFNAWTSNWEANGKAWMDTAWMDTTILTAFTMPLVDLSQVFSEPGVGASRFYLGLKQVKNGFRPKMVVVGVDSTNHDMIDYAKGEYVYDLSKSCPPYCKE